MQTGFVGDYGSEWEHVSAKTGSVDKKAPI